MGNSKTKPQQSNDKKSSPNNQENAISLDSQRNQTPNLYPQLQIRNCIRDEGISNDSEFADVLRNDGATCGESNRPAIFTIDTIQHENNTRTNGTDGLPTYEEAVAKVGSSNAPVTTVEQLNENVATSSRGRKQRRHHRQQNHRHDQQTDTDRSNHQGDATEIDGEHRRRHRRGGLRRHLAKIRQKKREAKQ